MNYETSRIIDCNGSKYRAGWDEHGYFTIEPVEQHPETGEWVRATDPEGNEIPWMNFPPEAADEIIAAIKEQ